MKNHFKFCVVNNSTNKVYVSDIKKLLSWYNTLIDNNISSFKEVEEEMVEKKTSEN